VDRIFIEELRTEAWVGIYPRERAASQTVELHLEIGVPRGAVHTDRIADTIDYARVISRIRADLQAKHFNLLEKLAEHVAEMLIHEFGAPWVTVSVAKVGVMKGVRRVGVSIERSRA
jgi:dihydroneopterin aldolase